jgi:hypothetical protein
MPENGPSGLTSGEWKRGISHHASTLLSISLKSRIDIAPRSLGKEEELTLGNLS